MGSQSGPVEAYRAQKGVRARVRAAGKGLNGDDRQTDDSPIIVKYYCCLLIIIGLFIYF